MDHQWGDFNNWFFSKSDKKNIWDGIGVNLNDGTDLIITTHRDMGKNKVMDRGALYIQPGSNPQVLSHLTMEPTDSWKSPQTHVVYPIKWKVSIPELEIEFEFNPFLKEQEIPFKTLNPWLLLLALPFRSSMMSIILAVHLNGPNKPGKTFHQAN